MKFENTSVYNFENAIRGMRNALSSWDRSDSWASDFTEDKKDGFVFGNKDLELAQKLIKAGSPHCKFLRQIFISADISAPRYIWAEYDTYKVGTTANSCSTIHTIMKTPITINLFEVDDDYEYRKAYWNVALDYMEQLRQLYNETKDIKYFRALKQALPESFIQMRTCTMNYENVRNMVQQRKNHKLKEWSEDFINWAKSLPYAEELIFI